MKNILLAFFLLVSSVCFAQVVPPTYTAVPGTDPVTGIIQSGGTALRLGDDSSRRISLGFDFSFYGTTYNSAYVSSNGFLSFTSSNNGCCSGYSLPNTYIPNSIYGVWTDLISGTNPYVQTTGTQGNREFIVGYYGTGEYGVFGNNATFEIQLFETSNKIQLVYGDINMRYHTFTSGIMGSNNTQYLQIYNGRDGSAVSNKSYCISYDNSCAPTQTTTTVNCNSNPTDPSCQNNNSSPVTTVQNAAVPTQTTQTTATPVTTSNSTSVASDSSNPTTTSVPIQQSTDTTSTQSASSTPITQSQPSVTTQSDPVSQVTQQTLTQQQLHKLAQAAAKVHLLQLATIQTH